MSKLLEFGDIPEGATHMTAGILLDDGHFQPSVVMTVDEVRGLQAIMEETGMSFEELAEYCASEWPEDQAQ